METSGYGVLEDMAFVEELILMEETNIKFKKVKMD
jgi:hypothetical protein